MYSFLVSYNVLLDYLIFGLLALVIGPSLVLGRVQIKLGVLIPALSVKEDIPDKTQALTAIQIGIEKVVMEGMVKDVDFILNYRDSNCSEALAPLHAMDMYYKKEAHVFFGPMCTYAVAPVARYTPYWNIPVISPGARAKGFEDKHQYRLLTRMSGSFSNTADVVHSILSKFSWRHIGMIYHNNIVDNKADADTYFLCKPVFEKRDKSIEHWYARIDVNYMDQFNLGSILQKGSLKSRIFIKIVKTGAWFWLTYPWHIEVSNICSLTKLLVICRPLQ